MECSVEEYCEVYVDVEVERQESRGKGAEGVAWL
jgi:hypothetical protein